ncbi:phage tail protein, partial [Streptomyces celluloflavus]
MTTPLSFSKATPGTPAPASYRGTVPDLRSVHPLGDQLPGVYADDDFAQRFVEGLDVVLAPLFNVLDCLDAYFMPALAPEDFVDWLATWVGAELEGTEALPVRRYAVATAVGLHRLRGTSQGLRGALQLAFGVSPEITESGGATWSARPRGRGPPAPPPPPPDTPPVGDPAPAGPHPRRAGGGGA